MTIFSGNKASKFSPEGISLNILSDKFDTLAYSEYGEKFGSIIKFKNIYGFQFHPEKSNEIGIKLIKNFCNL